MTGQARWSRIRNRGVVSNFTTGMVLYDREDTVPFGEGLFAVPLSRLWTAGK